MKPTSANAAAARLDELRKWLRSVLAFSDLESADEPSLLAAGQVEALCRALPIELALLRFGAAQGASEHVACRDGDRSPERVRRVGAALAGALAAEPAPASLPHPFADGELRLCTTRVGAGDDAVVLAAAARDPEFPREEERLLLAVAVRQIATAWRGYNAGHARAALAAIVASSDDAIVGKTLQGTITSWNAGAQRVFGYTEAEAIGRSIEMLIPPEHVDEEQQILARLRRGERIEHYETVRVRKDGQRIDVSLTVSPVRDDRGRIVGASKIARDVTARRLAERETEALLAREQEALRESQLLVDLARKLGAELDSDRLVQEITDTATLLTGAEVGAFFHNVEGPESERYALYTLSGARRAAFEPLGMPRNTAIFGPTFAGGPPVRIDDVLSDPRYGHNSPYSGMPP